MIFVQSLTELEEASENLKSKGYYKNCSNEFMEYVRKRSERAQHAWQEEDDEARTGEEEQEQEQDACGSSEEDQGQEEVKEEEVT